MGVISKDSNQVKLFYHSDNPSGKETLGYAKASEKSFLAIDLAKNNLSGTQWVEIAKSLDMSVGDLVDTSHPDFKEAYGTDQAVMDQHNWIKVLEKKPQMVAFPIALVGERFHAIKSPSDFNGLYESDSAEIEKPYNK